MAPPNTVAHLLVSLPSSGSISGVKLHTQHPDDKYFTSLDLAQGNWTALGLSGSAWPPTVSAISDKIPPDSSGFFGLLFFVTSSTPLGSITTREYKQRYEMYRFHLIQAFLLWNSEHQPGSEAEPKKLVYILSTKPEVVPAAKKHTPKQDKLDDEATEEPTRLVLPRLNHQDESLLGILTDVASRLGFGLCLAELTHEQRHLSHAYRRDIDGDDPNDTGYEEGAYQRRIYIDEQSYRPICTGQTPSMGWDLSSLIEGRERFGWNVSYLREIVPRDPFEGGCVFCSTK